MRSRISEQPRLALATLSLTVTVSYGVFVYAFAVLLEPMERDLAVTRGQASLALSVALFVSAVAAFPVGRWLDRRGPRELMTFGSLLGAATLLGWAAAGTLWQLYAVFALMGVAMAAVLYGPAFAVIAKLFWPAPRRAMTILTLFGGLAAIVFTPLIQTLAHATGWRTTLVVLAGITIVLTAIPHAAFLPRAATSEVAQGLQTDGDSVSARVALRGISFWALTLALFVAYFISLALVVHLIPYLTALGYSAAFAALAAGLVGAMQIPGRALLLPLEGRVPRAVLTTGIFALEALALLILLAAGSAATVLVFVVCFGMVRGMVPLVGATLLADFYGPASYGAIGGVMAFFTNTAQALAPGGVGLLYDQLHGYRDVLVILVVAGIVGAVSALWAERRDPRRPAQAVGSEPLLSLAAQLEAAQPWADRRPADD